MINRISYFLTLILFLPSAYVSPPGYSDGLLENNPAIVNETDFFSLSVNSEDYTEIIS